MSNCGRRATRWGGRGVRRLGSDRSRAIVALTRAPCVVQHNHNHNNLRKTLRSQEMLSRLPWVCYLVLSQRDQGRRLCVPKAAQLFIERRLLLLQIVLKIVRRGCHVPERHYRRPRLQQYVTRGSCSPVFAYLYASFASQPHLPFN